jgi:hypothetical protein
MSKNARTEVSRLGEDTIRALTGISQFGEDTVSPLTKVSQVRDNTVRALTEVPLVGDDFLSAFAAVHGNIFMCNSLPCPFSDKIFDLFDTKTPAVFKIFLPYVELLMHIISQIKLSLTMNSIAKDNHFFNFQISISWLNLILSPSGYRYVEQRELHSTSK